MEEQDLMTILIQTGFNIERIFEDKAIKEKAYRVLKYRNDLAIAELNRRVADSSHESSGLNIPVVSVNEGSEFLRVGVAVCPHFDKCINNGKNEHCDLQTFQEIDCFIGQTER